MEAWQIMPLAALGRLGRVSEVVFVAAWSMLQRHPMKDSPSLWED